jgi:general secretion pathway protein D
MRWFSGIVSVVLCSVAWGQSAPDPMQQLRECSQLRTPKACGASKKEIKQARRDFARGLKLQQQGNSDKALEAFESAASAVPRDIEYVTAREVLRQKLVFDHLKSGNDLLMRSQPEQAAAKFRQALELDPKNDFAQERLQDSAGQRLPAGLPSLKVFEDAGELTVYPKASPASLHVRGDTRALYQAIGTAFGVRPVFDESVPSKQLRFDVDDVSFSTAMSLAGAMTKTFWTPLSAREVFIAADSTQNRAQFERMSLRTFYVPDVATKEELNDLVNVLRTIFEMRFITQQPGNSTLTVRAPRRLLDAATRLMGSMDTGRPQVMLDFQVYEVNHSMLRNIGLDIPVQWQMFSLGGAALALLQQPGVQDLINQLISGGGINQANTTAIAALLQQLQSQSQNPLLKTPFGTFGGGETRFAVPFPPATANFSRNESRVTTLEHVTLRASHGNPASMLLGTRFPILNATFAPIFNTAAISKVLQNQSFIAPFPSFTYEDLGVSIKATPRIHGTSAVTLDIAVEIKALGTQSFNGVPVISNRQYKGMITVADGEPGVIAGMLQKSESRAVQGIPGIVHIPGLGTVTSDRTKQVDETELLLLITPRIIRGPAQSGPVIPIPAS